MRFDEVICWRAECRLGPSYIFSCVFVESNEGVKLPLACAPKFYRIYVARLLYEKGLCEILEVHRLMGPYRGKSSVWERGFV